MSALAPALSPGECARNVRAMRRENDALFLRLLKMMLPAFLTIDGLRILAALPGSMFSGHPLAIDLIARMAEFYFYGFLAISWHRLAIQGIGSMEIANPYSPRKGEIRFLLIMAGIAIAAFPAILLPATAIAALTGSKTLAALSMLAVCIPVLYAGYALYFKLPAQAIGRPLSIAAAFRVARGNFWRFFWAYWLAVWRVLLLIFAYFTVTGLILGVGFALRDINVEALSPTLIETLSVLLELPVQIVFYPLCVAMAVGTLSNYYMCGFSRGFDSDEGQAGAR